MKHLILTTVLIFQVGCYEKQWHNENYTYVGGSEQYTLGQSTQIEDRFYLAGAEIFFTLIPSTRNSIEGFQNSYTRKGPYKLLIRANGFIDSHQRFIVDSYSFRSSQERGFDVDLPTDTSFFERFEAPNNRNTDGVAKAFFTFPELLNLDWEQDEHLFATISVTIETNEGNESRVFELEFYPYLDAGKQFTPVSQ